MKKCPVCSFGVRESSLRDDASRREASTTGLCQTCQDGYFGIDPKVEKNASNQSGGSIDKASVNQTPDGPTEGTLPQWIVEANEKQGEVT